MPLTAKAKIVEFNKPAAMQDLPVSNEELLDLCATLRDDLIETRNEIQGLRDTVDHFASTCHALTLECIQLKTNSDIFRDHLAYLSENTTAAYADRMIPDFLQTQAN